MQLMRHLVLLCSLHPDIVEAKEKLDLLQAASDTLTKSLRQELAQVVLRFGRDFQEEFAANRSSSIEENRVELTTPLAIIDATEALVRDIKDLMVESESRGSKLVEEESTADLITTHSHFMGRLISVRTEQERKEQGKGSWNAKEATKRLLYIYHHFIAALKLDVFSSDTASNLYEAKTKAAEEYKALYKRLEIQLPDQARLLMCTIGSSHRLPGDKNNSIDDELAHDFELLQLHDSNDTRGALKDTIVIFDEAGCIPAYELLGLTRLERNIKALVLVGKICVLQ